MGNNALPDQGLEKAKLFELMKAEKSKDVDWRGGRLPGFYTHFANDDVQDVGYQAMQEFFSTNPLGPGAFPSVKNFEDDVVRWCLDLFNATGGTGNLTSGGTESIFMAMKTAREWAKATRPEVIRPKMVISHTAHPAFSKAGKYLEIDVVRVPPRQDFKTDIAALKAQLDNNTIIMVGSAPQFTVGVFDQIDELSEIALENNIWLHTDACVGGFLSPFAEMLGHEIPPWDFRVAGVCSISADLHKYGFVPKGASIVAFADEEYRRYQMFDFENWSRGRYVTPTFAGTRSGGAIAASWAVMRYLGNDGYKKIVSEIWAVKEKLITGIASIDSLHICGDPELTLLSYGSDALDINAVATGLSANGWYTVAPSPDPVAINLGIVSLAFGAVVDEYIADLTQVVEDVRAGKTVSDESVFGSYGGK